jgi:hypothetical protein
MVIYYCDNIKHFGEGWKVRRVDESFVDSLLILVLFGYNLDNKHYFCVISIFEIKTLW